MQELRTSFQYDLTDLIGKLESTNRHINVPSKFLCLPRKIVCANCGKNQVFLFITIFK